MNTKELPIPSHFDRRKVGEVWRVDYQNRAKEANEWAQHNNVQAAARDRQQVRLLLVDCQNTFCIPDFELFVAGRSSNGAVEDNIRLCEFLYRNLGCITHISATMDTHLAMQIFHPVFLINDKGEHPQPMSQISVADVESGKWKANPAVAGSVLGRDYDALQAYLMYYCRKLQESGKYTLMIWPYHAMQGGIGHCLVSALEEALFFWSIARKSQAEFEVKGNNPLTENYSVLRPEVLEDHKKNIIAKRNMQLIQTLLDADALIIAGQAKSHCVAWTIEDLLDEIQTRDPMLAKKVYLLEDCTSPVVVPGVVDFTDQASAAFRKFSEAGMHIVKSTDPMSSWPGIDL